MGTLSLWFAALPELTPLIGIPEASEAKEIGRTCLAGRLLPRGWEGNGGDGSKRISLAGRGWGVWGGARQCDGFRGSIHSRQSLSEQLQGWPCLLELCVGRMGTVFSKREL